MGRKGKRERKNEGGPREGKEKEEKEKKIEDESRMSRK